MRESKDERKGGEKERRIKGGVETTRTKLSQGTRTKWQNPFIAVTQLRTWAVRGKSQNDSARLCSLETGRVSTTLTSTINIMLMRSACLRLLPEERINYQSSGPGEKIVQHAVAMKFLVELLIVENYLLDEAVIKYTHRLFGARRDWWSVS